MADSIGDEGLQDDGETIAAIPKGDAQRDLILLVPRASDKDVRRRDTGFGYSEKEPKNHEAGEIESTGSAKEDDGPHQRCVGYESAQRDIGKKPCRKRLEG